MLTKIDTISGRAVVVPGDDIDTDRIIPASFMKCVTFDGLGQYAFYDERFDEKGNSKGHPMDAPEHEGATILISGRNFGCGSSREHAPQALYRFGFRAIIAENFAEIFFGNSTKLGIPCLSLPAKELAELTAWAQANPSGEISIDLPNKELRAGDKTWTFIQPEAARESLINGKYDPLAFLIANKDVIAKTAASLPYMAWNKG